MRIIRCYVHPKTMASRDGHDDPLGEVSFFQAFVERYPNDVDITLVEWPTAETPKAPTAKGNRTLRGGIGNVPAPLLKPKLVDVLITHLTQAKQPALVLPSYHLSSTELDRLVAFCLEQGHIPFICSEMMLSAEKRATDVYLWREMDRLIAKIRPIQPTCNGQCPKKPKNKRESTLIPA